MRNGNSSHRSKDPPPDLGRRHVRRPVAHHGMLRQDPALERSGDPGLNINTFLLCAIFPKLRLAPFQSYKIVCVKTSNNTHAERAKAFVSDAEVSSLNPI